jgi:hypothetical protein
MNKNAMLETRTKHIRSQIDECLRDLKGLMETKLDKAFYADHGL